MLFKNGFSLIELMVVIAIVGLLAAIAVPSYNRYTVGTKMAAAGVSVQGLMEQAKTFAAIHGHFPNAGELGYLGQNASANQANDAMAAKVIGPYFLPASQSGGFYGLGIIGDTCGQYGTVSVALDAVALGFASNVALDADPNRAGGIILQCDYWNYQGVIYDFCWYNVSSQSSTDADDLIPGWTNTNVSGQASGINRTIHEDNNTTYENATCQ